MFILTSLSYGQKCDCTSNLKWLIETFEQNDAGFQYVINKKGEKAYQEHNQMFIEKASKITEIDECHNLLNKWTFFFRKKHIYIQKIKNETNESQVTAVLPKEILQDEFDLYLSELKKSQNELEGIWQTGNYIIGIKKIDNTEKYVGFIINADNDWKQRQVKLEILKDENNKFMAYYFMGDYSKERFNEVELISPNFLRLGYIYLKRVKPIGEFNKSIDRYIKLIDTDEPMLLEISKNTLLFRIPSFHPSQKEVIDSILEKNHNRIISNKNLIIDLRNNGGGALKCVEKLLPYIYTNPIRIYGYKYLSSPLNNRHWENIIKNSANSVEFRKYAEKRLKKLNDNLGSFVVSYINPFSSKDTMYLKLDTIYPYPKNVAILVNENCGSTTEEFLFYAKQSKKVKIFGKKTYGVLDITDMHPVDFPSGDFRLYYCTAISMRLPEFDIDNYGIQPDFYFDRTIQPYEWVKRTEEILNYK